ncbi:MAG: hypothetical protein IPL75_21075 [Acidobacteria bacterium]|jgi:hypothetical protein|nr:hypothetical protein [Acidobacteriota bacterium]
MTNHQEFSALKRALRLALMATSATLAMGLALSLFVSGPAAPVAQSMLWLGLGMLVAIPILNVIDVVIIECRLKEWPFAAAGVAVLVLLAYTVAEKLIK